MENKNISIDVSDIQLPPTESTAVPNRPAVPPAQHINSAVCHGYVPQQCWNYPAQNYSTSSFYYPVNYYPFAQGYNVPIPVRPQFYYPMNSFYPSNPVVPSYRPNSITQNPFLRSIQSNKKELERVLSSSLPTKPTEETKPSAKRVNRFYPETWDKSVPTTSTSTNQQIFPGNLSENGQNCQPTADGKTTAFKKKCKKRSKKNKASLASELEKMKATTQYVTEHDTSSIVVTKSAEWTTNHQNRVERISSQLRNTSDVLFAEASVDYIVGTCVELEKDFYRITSDIDPTKVRPERILKKSLELVKEVWDDEGDYLYVSDQLKSIRQDMTVQGIRNNFALSVYDTHARIALLAGDSTEFGQCLSQLRLLMELPSCVFPANEEYLCYFILNYLFTRHDAGVMEVVGNLESEQMKNEFILAALTLQKAYQTCNFALFFKTYRTFPGLGKYIIDWFIDSFRSRVLTCLCQSYRPTLPVVSVQTILCFSEQEKLFDFLAEQGAVIDGDYIDCKQTFARIA